MFRRHSKCLWKEGRRDLVPTSPLGQAMVRGMGERPRSSWEQPEARGQLQDCRWRPVRVPATGLMGGQSCGLEGTAVGGRGAGKDVFSFWGRSCWLGMHLI